MIYSDKLLLLKRPNFENEFGFIKISCGPLCALLLASDSTVLDYVFFADVILAVAFWMDGLIPYSIVTIILVLVPNAIVRVFSARWNKMDEIFKWLL